MGSPPARNFSIPTSSTLISFASNSSCDVMSSSPVIVSAREKLSLLMFNETDAFGALNDLNSGKNHIPSFLGIIFVDEAKISCCLRIHITTQNLPSARCLIFLLSEVYKRNMTYVINEGRKKHSVKEEWLNP